MNSQEYSEDKLILAYQAAFNSGLLKIKEQEAEVKAADEQLQKLQAPTVYHGEIDVDSFLSKYAAIRNDAQAVLDRLRVAPPPAPTTRFRRRKPRTYTYLMLNRRNGYVKIGRSNNPQLRERTLQAEEPDIEMLANVLGAPELENRLHAEFKAFRLRGEWFKLSPEQIEQLKQRFRKKAA